MATVYPANIETKIGFDAIRSILRDACQSSMGKQEVDKIHFSSSFNEVIALLRQTDEMKGIIESGNNLPDISFNELDRWLSSLKVAGSYGSAEEFSRLRQSLVSFETTRVYFLKREGEDGKYHYPSLAGLFSDLKVFPNLVKEIERIIDKTGFVKDSASPELAETRQKLAGMQGSIARSVQRIFAQAVKEGIADKDSAPTFRDGRVVIPVAAGNKRRLQGIVHDESATGKTVFIEPAETVELSNRLRELEIEEQRLIVRILTLLTDEIRPYIDDILECNLLLGKIDFIMAKARFAIETGGEMPSISKHPEIDWYGARHPGLLLTLKKIGKEVEPLNITLEKKRRMLIISGPNAGGKSVALKTVGIVQYMCQCGLLPTLYSNSHVGIFSKIFIDLGDEQSIENDLSTYSSHLKNMRYFLLHSDSKTLVLIDEIGSGTEPNIGSALAKAILEELAGTHCFGVITTHYHNLKKFAEDSDSFVNGAMLYDRQKLQPTFQLSIGNPGSSFALEIAGKIGLPKNVIHRAKEDVGEDYVESDRFMMEIARDRRYWQTKRAGIKEKEVKLEALENRYKGLIEDLNKKRRELIEEARKEALNIVAGANRKIENTISEIRKIEAEKEKTKQIRQGMEEFRKNLETQENDSIDLKPKNISPKRKGEKKKKDKQVPTKVESTATKNIKKEIKPGEYVKMTGSNSVGQILSISGKEAEVAFGNLRTMVKLSKLEWAPKPSQRPTASGYTLLNSTSSDSSRERQLNFRDELDIRGMRADEALSNLTRFIDDALQFGIRKVRVLHGTGAGILRQLVRQQLSATPGVSKFADEDVRMGGSGITVVDL